MKKEWMCCRPCARDKHTDICQECSSDLIGARHRFYIITIILTLMIFCILLMLVHLSIQKWVPNEFCRPTATENSICGTFQAAVHRMNPYSQSEPRINMNKANTALHMFSQVDNNVNPKP